MYLCRSKAKETKFLESVFRKLTKCQSPHLFLVRIVIPQDALLLIVETLISAFGWSISRSPSALLICQLIQSEEHVMMNTLVRYNSTHTAHSCPGNEPRLHVVWYQYSVKSIFYYKTLLDKWKKEYNLRLNQVLLTSTFRSVEDVLEGRRFHRRFGPRRSLIRWELGLQSIWIRCNPLSNDGIKVGAELFR